MIPMGPLTGRYRGDEHFSRVLSDVKSPLPVHQVKTLLLGCIAATRVPRLNDVVATVCGGEAPVFASQDQVQDLLGGLADLWNRLIVHQGGVPFHLAPLDCSADAAGIACHASVRLEELLGFVRGLDLGGTDPRRMSKSGRDAMRVLGEGMGFLEAYKEAVTGDSKHGEEWLRQSLATLRQMDGVLEDALVDVMREQFLRRTRPRRTKQPVAPSQASPPGPRPGRNDPCPCGSGKKYKNCCGKVEGGKDHFPPLLP